jgi:phospholipid/cholesterol/gamma-HCH transport system substrate-binding protein
MFVIISLGIFAYMLVQLGMFRFNLAKYAPYEICFDDVSGLSVKACVKIAGVKVGWIEKISLSNDGSQARVHIRIKNRYQLHQDAYAVIRQEGVLGSRYLEIVSGSPQQPLLRAGTLLPEAGRKQASIESVLAQCQEVVEHARAISRSLDCALGGDGRAKKLEQLVDNLAQASEHIVQFSRTLSSVLSTNERSLNQMIEDCQKVASQTRQLIPQVQTTIDSLSRRLDQEILPTFNTSVQQVAHKLEHAADAIEQTVKQAREGIDSVTSISQKIDNGQGLLGQLINDAQIYNDIKSVAGTFKDSIDRINKIGVDVDAHGESMFRPVEEYCHCNNKGYLNMRMYTTNDWFYNLGLVTSEKGWPSRCYECECFCNAQGQCIDPSKIVIDDGSVVVAPQAGRVCMKRNDTRFDIQVGKIFWQQLTLRAGTFENTFGLAADWQIPIDSQVLRWIMSLEMFDLHGQNRFCCDRRPHLKWANRISLFNNIYITFGADDFISKYCKNAFFGGGLRFSDDDLKHVASKFGILNTHN